MGGVLLAIEQGGGEPAVAGDLALHRLASRGEEAVGRHDRGRTVVEEVGPDRPDVGKLCRHGSRLP